MFGWGDGIPVDEIATSPVPAPTSLGDTSPLIQWKYNEDDVERRAKLERAIQMLNPIYGDIFDMYGIEHPKTPQGIELIRNTGQVKEGLNSALNPGLDRRAFYKHGEPFRIYVNDSFYNWGDDGDEPRAVTLGHEAVHAMGMSRHEAHPRAKKGMTDSELSRMFSDDVRKVIRARKKKDKK